MGSRKTTTGQGAWAAAYRLTEPRISAVNAPIPREPTTSIEAPDPASATAWAGDPPSPSASTRTLGATAAARCDAAARDRLRASTTVSATVATPDAVSCTAIRGGSAAADTIRSGTPRSSASAAAHSTARSDSSEPSVAATIGPAVIVNLPAEPGRAGVNREVPRPQDSLPPAGTNRVLTHGEIMDPGPGGRQDTVPAVTARRQPGESGVRRFR
jgi:hypothetical protein